MTHLIWSGAWRIRTDLCLLFFDQVTSGSCSQDGHRVSLKCVDAIYCSLCCMSGCLLSSLTWDEWAQYYLCPTWDGRGLTQTPIRLFPQHEYRYKHISLKGCSCQLITPSEMSWTNWHLVEIQGKSALYFILCDFFISSHSLQHSIRKEKCIPWFYLSLFWCKYKWSFKFSFWACKEFERF